MKTMNIICIIIWCFELLVGVIALAGKAEVSPIMFISASLICILHFIRNLEGWK